MSCIPSSLVNPSQDGCTDTKAQRSTPSSSSNKRPDADRDSGIRAELRSYTTVFVNTGAVNLQLSVPAIVRHQQGTFQVRFPIDTGAEVCW